MSNFMKIYRVGFSSVRADRRDEANVALCNLVNAPKNEFFFLRRYNFREVLAFSTNSFHLGRFLMQSFQFVIFIFVISLYTSSSHLFLGLSSDLVPKNELLCLIATLLYVPFWSKRCRHSVTWH
jgi:hypothetical protein